MVDKYYNGAIEQVAGRLGEDAGNSLMVRYGNDFSIGELESVKKYMGSEDLFFACHEFSYGEFPGGYEPYLAIISRMFRKYRKCGFEEFMQECGVYYLHRPILLSYFESGVCKREELILLDEVEYEQKRMTDAIERMLVKLSEFCPVLVLLNRFQLASRSTMLLTYRLLCCGCKNIGIILGINDVDSIPEFLLPEWDAIFEKMNEESRVCHIGTAKKREEEKADRGKYLDYGSEESGKRLNNLVELLDFDQAFYALVKIERRVKFDNFAITEDARYRILLQLANVSILTRELSKALEICEDIERLDIKGRELEVRCEHAYLVATAYMYQGRLAEAVSYAKRAQEYAAAMEDDFRIFKARLLEAQIQMSGWYNIFFCAQDVEVGEGLIEDLLRYNFKNHLAHIYIFAYDNKPEIVAKAYRSEELLVYFCRGVALAKEIGNEQLVTTAYQKNIMLASTNGMFEVSLLYSIRTYEALTCLESVEGGRIYSGIAYNLCAMGQNERAWTYYNRAVRLFYRLRKPEDIAEVQYNMSLNCIMIGEYERAEAYLMQCMKAVERLHLNSLRVCNISKLYGLLALVNILEGNRFSCERYIYNCRQFLNYVLEKEVDGPEQIHDYAKVDDDMFLYTFSNALLAWFDGETERAGEFFCQAESYLGRAQGNEFFSYTLFYKCRMSYFQKTGDMAGYENAMRMCREYEEAHGRKQSNLAAELLESLPPAEETGHLGEVPFQKLDGLIRQESILRAYKSKKRQMDFIPTWQKLIDMTGVSAEKMMDKIMKTFLNHFSVDCAVYVRYMERKPQVLYNNTGVELTLPVLSGIEQALRKNAGGFAVSKISSNYQEHQDVTSVFGEDNVCSMVAVPFFNDAHMESILIAYVLMKDNWHSSVNRYMLDEDDLNMYQLLFREVSYSLNRLEAYDKIYEMNAKLYLSAVMDQLTGIYNRNGFYQRIAGLMEDIKKGKRAPELGLMFIDLDNFKYYNDTFGHDAGDLILKKMAEIFEQLSRDRGFVCRYGGDEFIIMLYTANRDILEQTAGQIYRMIEASGGFEAEISEKIKQNVFIDEAHKISCSIGIVSASDIREEAQIHRMIKQADDLLYRVKTSTKGTYIIL